VLDFVEVPSLVVLGHYHTVQNLHRIDSKLVMVTETEIHYLANKGVQVGLIAL
jgi:hypothetical protein